MTSVDINMMYANDNSCANLVAVVRSLITDQLASEVNEKEYLSIMIDGGTDFSGIENKTIHCQFLKDGKPVNRMVGHKAFAHGHGQGRFFPLLMKDTLTSIFIY